jgi:adenosylhomocysteinase
MSWSITDLRTAYFTKIAHMCMAGHCQLVVLTHILPDREELLSALNMISPVSLVLAIPYSIHQPTLTRLKTIYNVQTPSMTQLKDHNSLLQLLTTHTVQNRPIIILEMGGYFADFLAYRYNKTMPIVIDGAVECSESGHKEYARVNSDMRIPAVSIARSSLKATENAFISISCVRAVDKLLRKTGMTIDGKRVAVMGFGRIGRGLAHTLRDHWCSVSVYDIDPIKMVSAVNEGFKVPSKRNTLRDAEIIFGATGTCSLSQEDFSFINNGALLASCSTKDVEFDLKNLHKNYHKTKAGDFDFYQNNQNFFYVAAEGHPVNFFDDATIGPAIALPQAEMMIAIKEIFKLRTEQKSGLHEISHENKHLLAAKWLEFFCDETSGRYKINF